MRQLLLLTFYLITFLSSGQARTITGKVLYDDLSPIFEAKILNRDTLQLGITDINGDFKIELPLGTDVLQFSFIGMELTSVRIPMDCDKVEIILFADGHYHYKSNKKVDRVRKERYDELPKLHSKAVAKGVFTNNSICYGRKFQPSRPRLDEISNELRVKRRLIKESFRKLEIGDTLRIPYSGTYRYDGTDRTTLHVYSYVVDGDKFECIIKGVIIGKRSNYDLTFRVTNCDLCKYKSLIYENRDMVVGQAFKHNMKYYKVLTK